MNKAKIFQLNLKINGKEKLQKWLYAECLELSAALIAYDLQPTEEHLEELCEEISDVRILLQQYFAFHEIETIREIVFKRNLKKYNLVLLADSISSQGYLLIGVKNIESAMILRQNVNHCMTDIIPNNELKIADYYVEKIKKLYIRLKSGEFS